MLLVLCGCAPTVTPAAATGEQAARQALLRFFQDLHDARYPAAAEGYAGSYDVMVEHNPGIDPDNHPALLEAACTINGAQCLIVQSARLAPAASNGGDFAFLVEFQNEDGSRFSLGPCCGAYPADAPPQTEFEFHVRPGSDGRFRVTTPPVYAP